MIGILNTYYFEDDPFSYQSDYGPMTEKYFNKIMPNAEFREYLVCKNELPKTIEECEGYIITGSAASCYDDLEWINKLSSFIKKCHKKKHKLLGICFGHQLIAHTLGGKCELSDKGWGIGIREFEIEKTPVWTKKSLKDISLIFSHQDQVTHLPKDATRIATEPFCPNQIFVIDKHVFCIQGHPEFTNEFATQRYDTRRDRIPDDVYLKAIKTMTSKHQGIELGKWINDFFNQKES